MKTLLKKLNPKKLPMIIATVILLLVLGYAGFSYLDTFQEEQELKQTQERNQDLELSGDYDEAINELKSIEEQSSSLTVKRDALTDIGISHMNKKDYPSAHKAFQEAYNLNVDPSEKLLRAGSYAAEQIDEYKAAISYYQDLIEISESRNESANIIDTYQEKIKELEQVNESTNS